MDLTPRTSVTTATRDKQWLASDHGTDCTRTLTLDVGAGSFAAVITNGGYSGGSFPDKVIPSGTPVRKTATGYQLATGSDRAEFHLYEDVVVHADSTKVGAAGLWHGVVVAAKVPGTFADANKLAANVLYV